ncbi:MAG: FadR family transcriptional regulator [Rhizobium sp.]|nr:FadR family transcriptional regulator [Rhizobium sp.]
MKRVMRSRAENDGPHVRLPQIEPVRLYRQIADLLNTRIDQGLFPVGTFLPAERELAEQLGVSRTSVREALIALEVSGQVSIRPGHGVQVLSGSQQLANGAPQGETDIGPIQIMDARRHVESKTAELAAVNHTSENLERMRNAMALQAEAASATAPQYREGDCNFHVEIAKASGNPAYELLVASLWEFRTKPLFRRFEELLVGPDRPKKTALEHQAIFDAIATRDGRAATRLMKAHIDEVLKAFIKGSSDR